MTSFRRQSIAGMLVYLLAVYALCLSLMSFIEAIDLRLSAGKWLLAGSKVDPLYEAGSSLGFYASLLLALNFVLATRWRWVERLFDGLGKVYALHAFSGKTALSFVVLHSAILIVQALPNWSLMVSYIVPGVDIAYSLGMIGTLGLLILVTLTIWMSLPQEFWLKTHRLMIIPFLGGTLHAIVLQLDWYMIAIALAGTVAWLYTRLIYPNRSYAAEVSAVRTLGDIRELVLAPHRSFTAAAGQFAFLSVPGAGSADRHPFSISRMDANGSIRMSVRKVGDFTHRLEQLMPGQKVRLYGPHGSFGRHVLDKKGSQVWIAGGIGITPFLSLLQAFGAERSPVPLCLVWSVRRPEDAVYRTEIEEFMRKLPNGRFELWVTSQQGRLSVNALAPIVADPARASFFICGPSDMVTDLTRQLRVSGVSVKRIISERFAIR